MVRQLNINKIKLGLILFFLGLSGVISLLASSLPMDNLPKEVLEKHSKETLKYLLLINPMLLLVFSTILGVFLYKKVNLNVPTLESMIEGETWVSTLNEQLKSGLIGGLLAGGLILLVGYAFNSLLPKEFLELNEKLELSPFTRLLYGGITEEILMRFGLMTLIVWAVSKITKNLNPSVYGIGIIFSSILFAIGHFPVAYQTVGEPSILLLVYILLGNSLGGIVFGWLYWKKGLESAMIAHISTHILILVVRQFTLIGS